MTIPVTDVHNELDALDPIPEVLTLASGFKVKIEELRLRQFLRLLRIVTRGVLPLLPDLSSFNITDTDASKEEFGGRLVSLILMGIPEAEDETIDFLKSMVSPGDLIEKPVLQKSDAETNKRLWAMLDQELTNPDLGDTVDLVEAIVKKEASDLQAFVKKVMKMFNQAVKMKQVPESLIQKLPEQNSSEESAAPSTKSSPSLNGPTTSAENLASNDYANTLP